MLIRSPIVEEAASFVPLIASLFMLHTARTTEAIRAEIPEASLLQMSAC